MDATRGCGQYLSDPIELPARMLDGRYRGATIRLYDVSPPESSFWVRVCLLPADAERLRGSKDEPGYCGTFGT